ncbi:MAG: hypothetical protein JNK72_14775 [Myxococcales bacterium]|nr:hypothetical protein [Myxococcales bacterium]
MSDAPDPDRAAEVHESPQTPTLDGLPVLPDTPRVLLAKEPVTAEDDTLAKPPVLNALSADAVAELRREGSWRIGARLIVALVTVIFSFRLAFDESLPRLLMGLLGAATLLLFVVTLVRGVAESGRQRAMLSALEQLLSYARERPEQAHAVEPQIAAIVATLRQPAAPMPWEATERTNALERE